MQEIQADKTTTGKGLSEIESESNNCKAVFSDVWWTEINDSDSFVIWGMSLKKCIKQSNNLLWFIVITFIVKIFLIHFVHNVALDLYFGKAWTKTSNHKVNGGCTQMLKNV